MTQTKQVENKKNVVSIIFYAILIPTILMNLVTAISGFADTIIVGNMLGEEALSAVTFNSPIFMYINTIASMLAVGGATTIGVLMGKGDQDSANQVFSTAVSWGVTIAIASSVIGIVFIDEVVQFLGATGDVTVLVKAYSSVLVVAIPIFVLNVLCAFFVRNDGRPNLAMAGMLTAIGVNIVFDIIFIGPCNMGIAGAAYAMAFSQFVSLVIIASHFFTKQNNLRFHLSYRGDLLLRIVRNGVGTSMTFTYQMIMMLVLNHLIMSVAGTEGMIVYSVVFNINLIAMSVFEGLSQTIQPIVSVYHGENNEKSIEETMYRVMKIGACICGSIILFIEIFPALFAQMFGVSEGALLDASVLATRVVAPAMIFMTMNVLLSYYFQSREMRSLPFIIVICRNLILLLTCVVILAKTFRFVGIWMAYPVAEALTLLLTMIVVKVIQKKNPEVQGILLLSKENLGYQKDYVLPADLEVIQLQEEQRILLCLEAQKAMVNPAVLALAMEEIGELAVSVVEINKNLTKSKVSHQKANIYASLNMKVDPEVGQLQVQFWNTGEKQEPSCSNQETTYLVVLGQNRSSLTYPLS